MACTIGLLLALDAGRSMYARFGYRTPAAKYSGRPYDTDFPWPPGVQLESGAATGKRLYVRYCAMCHGLGGNGLGPAAGNLSAKPTDFQSGWFKYKSTPAGVTPTDEDLARVVGDGLPGSTMPWFRDLLRPEEIRAVVDYVKQLGAPHFDGARTPIAIPPPPAFDAARGRLLYDRHCAGCHGTDGRERGPLPVRPAHGDSGARDLTAPWTFRGGDQPEQLWLRVTTGIQPGTMPSFAAVLSPEERWEVVGYVRSLARPAPWESGGALQGPGQDGDLARRGDYLARGLTCTYCHTESVEPMTYNPRRFLGGGAATRAWPDGTVISPNLTPDVETGLGRWSEDDIVRALRRGRTPTRSLDLGFKPWFFYQFTDDDAHAVARFLKAVPPRRHRTPPPLRYGTVETVLGKLARLPLITPTKLEIPVPTGPFGEEEPGPLPWDWPQRALMDAQWLVLALGALALLVVGRRAPRFQWTRLRVALALGGLAVVALCAVISSLYAVVPREAMAGFVEKNLPRPDLARATPERRRMVERGRYLYKVSCVLCHQLDGGGGDRLSDPYAGDFTIRNITSHPTRGIGRWSEREIERALRSGITPEGRVMFWGFMPWDMFGNLDEEDVRALAAYVRELPPMDLETPPPTPAVKGHPRAITWRVDMSRIVRLMGR